MRLLGNVMIVGGVLLCLTWIFLPFGLGAIGVGALLRISARSRRAAS